MGKKQQKNTALRHPGADLMIISFVSIHDVSTCRDLRIVFIGNWQGDSLFLNFCVVLASQVSPQ